MIPTPDNHAHPIVVAATDAGMDVETVGDVYDAMVWLGSGEVDVDVVVVDVAGLDSSEMEFFDLAARYHWGTPVYVFGGGSAGVGSAKIDAALLRGARAAVDPARLANLLSDVPTRRGERAGPPGPKDTRAGDGIARGDGAIDVELERRLAALGPAEDTKAPAGPPEHAETQGDSPVGADGAPADRTEGGADGTGVHAVSRRSRGRRSRPASATDSPGKSKRGRRSAGEKTSARVPWRKYGDLPERTPPEGHKADVPAERPAASPSAEPCGDPPLLTPEELDALVGGRIAPAPLDDGSDSGEAQ
ncbi:MAG: hypothetical protein JSV19_12800 [Phycisphaerales bacterium]|nr:MAG: hypothetical protein JSV19_12800 [Phycisphaerales bacterium]